MFPFDPPEKNKDFQMFSGGSKGNTRKKRVKVVLVSLLLTLNAFTIKFSTLTCCFHLQP